MPRDDDGRRSWLAGRSRGEGLSMFGTQGLYLYQILRAFSKPTKDA